MKRANVLFLCLSAGSRTNEVAVRVPSATLKVSSNLLAASPTMANQIAHASAAIVNQIAQASAAMANHYAQASAAPHLDVHPVQCLSLGQTYYLEIGSLIIFRSWRCYIQRYVVQQYMRIYNVIDFPKYVQKLGQIRPLTPPTPTSSQQATVCIKMSKRIKLGWILSLQISAVPDLCCIVTWRSIESVGGVFDPIVSSATAVFERVKDKLAMIPCLLLAACDIYARDLTPLAFGGQQAWQRHLVQSSPQSSVSASDSSCMQC